MYDGASVGVVVPAHDEEQLVGGVIDSLPAIVDRCYVVDDCSTDGTWDEILAHVDPAVTPVVVGGEEGDGGATGPAERTDGGDRDTVGEVVRSGGPGPAQAASATEPEFDHTVVPVRHAENRGRGGAVKTGYRLALREELDVVVVMDGDGQMDPALLDRVVDPVVGAEADYAKGNRLAGAAYWEAMSRWRLFGNLLLSWLTKVASGYWGVRDSQNGYTAIRAEALAALDLDSLYDDYGFLNDVLVRLNVRGSRVVDVPMPAIYENEESGIEYRSFVPKLSWLLLRMCVWRLWVKYGPGDSGSSSVGTPD